MSVARYALSVQNLRDTFLKETSKRCQAILYDLEGAFQLPFHLHQTSIFLLGLLPNLWFRAHGKDWEANSL